MPFFGGFCKRKNHVSRNLISPMAYSDFLLYCRHIFQERKDAVFMKKLLISACLFFMTVNAGDEKDALCMRLTPEGNYFAQNNSVFTELTRLDIAGDMIWDGMSESSIHRHAEKLRAEFIDAIGGLPEPTPLKSKITGTLRRDGYRIEKLVFESRPGHYVTGYVFVPESSKYKAPFSVILIPCGHSLTVRSLFDIIPAYLRLS